MLTVLVVVAGTALAVALGRAAHRAGVAGHARLLGASARWRVPARVRPRLERALAEAAMEIEPESACELWLAGVGALAVVTVAVASALLPVVLLLGLLGGPIALHLARHRARAQFVAALPGTLEQVAAAMRGGASVHDAVAAQAEGDGPVTHDLRRVCARATLGSSLADALTTWPEERPLPSVRAAAGGLAVAASVGGAAADAIDGLAASLRERLGAVAEARALSAQARLSAVVVGAAPGGYLLLSAIADPSSIDTLFGTSTGRACLLAGLVLEALALLWMRRIVGSGAPE